MKEDPLEQAAKEYAEMHLDVSGNLGKYLVKAVFKDGAKWQINLKKNNMKQETLEEAAESYANMHHDVSATLGQYLVKAVFQDGAQWQQERMYSEEDVKNAFLEGWELRSGKLTFVKAKNKWFNEFKKK